MKLKPINFPKHNGNHERIIVNNKNKKLCKKSSCLMMLLKAFKMIIIIIRKSVSGNTLKAYLKSSLIPRCMRYWENICNIFWAWCSLRMHVVKMGILVTEYSIFVLSFGFKIWIWRLKLLNSRIQEKNKAWIQFLYPQLSLCTNQQINPFLLSELTTHQWPKQTHMS